VPPALRLGKYIVEGLLGPGGVTETYLAHLASDACGEIGQGAAETMVALKLLRSDRIAEPDYAKVAQRFLAAGKQLRDFHRPGFCKVVGLSDDPAATFIVTEHVAGTDLARFVEQSRGARSDVALVDPVLAGLIGSEIARLMHVGHSAKPMLCHLGLTPHNVMIMATGELVLLDCGIASTFRAITEQPPERWLFVAPELQGVDVAEAGLSDRQGVAADLYSLGALVHFLVTGRAPALPTTPTRPTRGAPTDLPDIPGISSNLGAALRTLLSPEPEDRPESAVVLVDWLADGVGLSRDRRQLIAEGLRAAESGALHVSEALPTSDAPAQRQPPPSKLPGKGPGFAGGIAETVREAKSPAKTAGSRRRGILATMVSSLIVAIATLVVFGPWPSRKQTWPVLDQGQESAPSVERRAAVPDPRGKRTQNGRGEATQAAESALGESVLSRVAGHLIVETVPPGATVWVDGAIKGKTFADIVVGGGEHRIVLILPGHRMFRDVVDTSRGTIVRRTLLPVESPGHGNGFISVECRTTEAFPVLIDEKETGLLCPAKMVPTATGKHMVGIFVPPEGRAVLVETTVETGPKPAVVKFSE
jgi:serine/threonine protein kinase